MFNISSSSSSKSPSCSQTTSDIPPEQTKTALNSIDGRLQSRVYGDESHIGSDNHLNQYKTLNHKGKHRDNPLKYFNQFQKPTATNNRFTEALSKERLDILEGLLQRPLSGSKNIRWQQVQVYLDDFKKAHHDETRWSSIKKLKESNLPLNSYLMTALISCLGELGQYQYARSFFLHVKEKGLITEYILLAICTAATKAPNKHELKEELIEIASKHHTYLNFYIIDTLLNFATTLEDKKYAQAVVTVVDKWHIPLNKASIGILVKLAATLEDKGYALEVANRRGGTLLDKVSIGILLNLAVTKEDIPYAREVADKWGTLLDEVSIGILLNLAATKEDIPYAREVLTLVDKWDISLNKVSIGTLLKLAVTKEDIPYAREVVALADTLAKRWDIPLNTFIDKASIGILSKLAATQGDMVYAREVLKLIDKGDTLLDEVNIGILLKLAATQEDIPYAREVVALADTLAKRWDIPLNTLIDKVSIGILSELAATRKDKDYAREVLKLVDKGDIPLDKVSIGILLNLAATLEDIPYAQEVLKLADTLAKRWDISLNTLIDKVSIGTLVKLAAILEDKEYAKEVANKWGALLDEVSIGILLNLAATQEDIPYAQEMLALVDKWRIPLDKISIGILVKLGITLEDKDYAQEVLTLANKWGALLDEVSIGTLLHLAATQGDMVYAQEVLALADKWRIPLGEVSIGTLFGVAISMALQGNRNSSLAFSKAVLGLAKGKGIWVNGQLLFENQLVELNKDHWHQACDAFYLSGDKTGAKGLLSEHDIYLEPKPESNDYIKLDFHGWSKYSSYLGLEWYLEKDLLAQSSREIKDLHLVVGQGFHSNSLHSNSLNGSPVRRGVEKLLDEWDMETYVPENEGSKNRGRIGLRLQSGANLQIGANLQKILFRIATTDLFPTPHENLKLKLDSAFDIFESAFSMLRQLYPTLPLKAVVEGLSEACEHASYFVNYHGKDFIENYTTLDIDSNDEDALTVGAIIAAVQQRVMPSAVASASSSPIL